MLAVVKTPLTSFEVKGDIPQGLLNYIKEHHSKGLEITEDDDNELIDSDDIELLQKTIEALRPSNFVKTYRENRGWTQTELGMKLGGIHKNTISGIETGRRPISKKMAFEFSEVFDEPVHHFLEK